MTAGTFFLLMLFTALVGVVLGEGLQHLTEWLDRRRRRALASAQPKRASEAAPDTDAEPLVELVLAHRIAAPRVPEDLEQAGADELGVYVTCQCGAVRLRRVGDAFAYVGAGKRNHVCGPLAEAISSGSMGGDPSAGDS